MMMTLPHIDWSFSLDLVRESDMGSYIEVSSRPLETIFCLHNYIPGNSFSINYFRDKSL